MNDFFLNSITELIVNLPGFRLLALCTILLLLKMHAVGFYTGVVRKRVNATVNPEDAVAYKLQPADAEHPEVARVLRAHRNDLENIPMFLFLALLAILVGASQLGMRVALIAYTAARVGFSIAYLRAMQPWRSVSFVVGQLSLLAVVVMLLVQLFAV